MKSSSCKQKGRRLQKWVAEQVGMVTGLSVGPDEDIASRGMGQAGMDIRLSPRARAIFPYAIECKNSERWSIPEWWLQTKLNAAGLNPILIVGRNNTLPMVIMDAAHFFDLLAGNVPTVEKSRRLANGN